MTEPTTSPRTRSGAGANVLSIVSFVLSGIAVFFIPILFGAGAIATGAIGMVRKEPWGKIALIVAISATILGMVLGALLFTALQT